MHALVDGCVRDLDFVPPTSKQNGQNICSKKQINAADIVMECLDIFEKMQAEYKQSGMATQQEHSI